MVFQNTKCLKQEFKYTSTSLSVREIPFKLKNSIRKSLTACIFFKCITLSPQICCCCSASCPDIVVVFVFACTWIPYCFSLSVDLYEKMFAADAFVLVLFLSTFLEFDSLEQFQPNFVDLVDFNYQVFGVYCLLSSRSKIQASICINIQSSHV